VLFAIAFCGSLFSAAVDAKAQAIVAAMTARERLALVVGSTGTPVRNGVPTGAVGSAGYVPGIRRLGVPALQETDAGLGITNPDNRRRGDVATAFASGLSLASTWDPQIAYRDGTAIGDEARRKGLNVLLGPGLNLARDPRNGRNFEYLGEDPLLAGTLAGAEICGVQDQHVVATMKHFALNDQETGRNALSADIDEAEMRESDLLAFELAAQSGHPGAVMCAYNRVNGIYACQNAHLLNDILKRDWSFPGWVLSDWGAVHSLEAATNGLDQESAADNDAAQSGAEFFGAPLRAAVAAGSVALSRLNDMDVRIVRAMLAVGLFDHPAKRSSIDYAAHGAAALDAAERGIVMLKNNGALPLSPTVHRIAIIGGHADDGVLSGSGSSRVSPVGFALSVPLGGENATAFYIRSSPLAAIRSLAPRAAVSYINGTYPSMAAALARQVDVPIVFATQWLSEGSDAPNLTLPGEQDALIAAVAAANPNTVVVLETGGPVTMPWLDRVNAVVEAWYPGQRGGDAIADVLFGRVDATGRLPITFPAGDAQLAHARVPGLDALVAKWANGEYGLEPFSVSYPEGSDVGYRWFVKQQVSPLFAFGYGLSYTTFHYGDFALSGGGTLTARFTVTNTGMRPGTDTPQLYLTRRVAMPQMRLLGWAKVSLRPGESRRVSIVAEPHILADFDPVADAWKIPAGPYEASLGSASDRLTAHAIATITAQTLKP
jgi:beta-glucosidase